VNVVLENAAKYVQGEYELTFINKDGQMAVAKFPVDPLKLNAVGNLTAGGTPVTITVTGENFGDNMNAEWIDPSKTVIPTNKVNKKSDKEAGREGLYRRHAGPGNRAAHQPQNSPPPRIPTKK
jgi:hypothetical protein